jgi:hypothetical protein
MTAEELEEKIEFFEDNLPQTLENRYYIGGLYGFLGRMYGDKKSWLSAFSNGKEAKNIYEKIIQEKPDFFES